MTYAIDFEPDALKELKTLRKADQVKILEAIQHFCEKVQRGGVNVMKMITANELQKHLKTYLREAQSEEIVVTLDDGTLVGLSGLDADDLSDAEIERDPRFAQLIAERRSHYQQAGGISLDQVRQDLIDELAEDLNHPDPTVQQEAADLLSALKTLRSHT